MNADIDWAAELTLDMGGDGIFPFVEDEDGNITGYGHQDREEFAAAVNRYDEVCAGPLDEDMLTSADDVVHTWGLPYVDGTATEDWRLRRVPEGTEGAIPVTAIWNQR